LSGCAETFAGSRKPVPGARAQSAIFEAEGEGTITYEGKDRPLLTCH
jgi:(S)-ureidoglycine aminohydrolase